MVFAHRILTLVRRPTTTAFGARRCFATFGGGGSRPAFYDMTSDTATEVTDAMMDIMRTASRRDDVFGDDPSIKELEHHVAKLLGHEDALFCVSGCMTNQLGLRTLLTQPPHSVLADARSHINLYECGGLAYNSQASLTAVTPTNEAYLTPDDIENNLVTDDLHGALTRVIALENTLNGTIMPLDAMDAIHALARRKGILLHLDGARLWNASQATGIALDRYGAMFDTVSICVSKGVGAPIGSLLAGSKERMQRARKIRKLMGGGWRQAGLLAATAKHCIDTIVPTMPETHALTRRLADHLEGLGIRLLLPCETNMLFIDTHPWMTIAQLADRLKEKNIIISRDEGTVTRLVLHYQIDDKAVQDFMDVATSLVQEMVKQGGSTIHPEDRTHTIGKAYPSSR